MILAIPGMAQSQYSYWNNIFEEQAPAGSGVEGLYIVDSSIVSFGLLDNISGSHFQFRELSNDGAQTQYSELLKPPELSGTSYFYGDASLYCEGKIYAVGQNKYTNTIPPIKAILVSWNPDYSIDWYVNYGEITADTAWFEFEYALINSQQQLVCAGKKGFETDFWDLWMDNWWLIMAWYDLDGNLLHEATIDDLPDESPKAITDMVQLPDDRYLMCGLTGSSNQKDPFILTVDITGEYQDQLLLGGAYSDASGSIVVDESGDSALFAYIHCNFGDPGELRNLQLHIAHIGLDDLTLEWEQEYAFDEIGLLSWTLGVNDFMRTSDGGSLILMNHSQDDEEPYYKSFLVKLNANQEVEWYHWYEAGLPCGYCYLSDLEIAPDGGYVMAGLANVYYPGAEYSVDRTWILKTDACGEVEYNGCAPVNTSGELQHTFSLKTWPNPFREVVHVETSGRVEKLVVRDVLGNAVSSREGASTQSLSEIDLSYLRQGMYLLEVHLEDGEILLRPLVKN